MLRRLKREVARDLPDRIEQRRDCELGEEQRKLYLAELRRSRDEVMNCVAERGLGRSSIHVLAALTRLRQICCHPSLVGSDSPSGKTETLFELLEPLIAENQKVLVFSQFVQMLRILEKECATRQIRTHILTGETKNRQEVMENFQNDPNGSVFLLSLRAAGTGLNLTTASYVMLYDPWWNPAVEAQAIDRSHRIGQTETVNAYRLIAPGTGGREDLGTATAQGQDHRRRAGRAGIRHESFARRPGVFVQGGLISAGPKCPERDAGRRAKSGRRAKEKSCSSGKSCPN